MFAAKSSQPTTLKARLREGFTWKWIRLSLLANALIAILLTIVSIGDGRELPLKFGISCAFSFCIGTSIYILGLCCDFINSWRLAFKGLGMTVLFVVGGWIGSGLAILILTQILQIHIQGHQLQDALTTCTLLAVFFGGVVWLYFGLYEKLEKTAARLAEKEVSEQRLLQLKTRTELEVLRAKVHPHFLFNTLNSIASLIPLDPVRAEEMVQKLSALFRYALDTGNHELVRLEDEIRIIGDYLEIEKVRLGERLHYRIDIDPALNGISVPSLLLQPLVENSINHGIAPLPAGGKIAVCCRRENGHCHIEISDTGTGFDPDIPSKGFGLRGVVERLDLHYGDQHRFGIERLGGARISFRLPL